MRKITQKITLSILSTVALLGLAACGSDEKPTPVTVVAAPAAPSSVAVPTKGQQLRDLQKAYDDGIITHDEYKEQKLRVLGE